MTHSEFAEKTTQPIYKRPRVLVADCTDELREAIRGWQNELLCEMVVCEDPDSALMLASGKKFDAIIIGVEAGGEERAALLASKLHQIPDKKNVPVAFLVADEQSIAIIEKAEPKCYVCFSKPKDFDAMAKISSRLMTFEHFNALVVSSVAPVTAKLSLALKDASINTKCSLHPHRYLEFLYDFEPEVFLVDVDIKSPPPAEICEKLHKTKRWEAMAVVLFSSAGKDVDSELMESCQAVAFVDLSAAEKTGATIKNIARGVREKTQKRSDNDFLTGLPLTNQLYEKYVPLMAESKGSPLSLTLALVDIQQLNAINEAAGHVVGDRILSAVSNFLLQRVDGTPAMICRWNEDEFVIMLKATTEAAKSLIKNAVLDFSLIKIPSYDQPVKLRAGVSSFPDDAASLDALLDLAYWRLHNAKKDPDGVCFK
jgi:diguanylate cyclase (GGDEF)-like protein